MKEKTLPMKARNIGFLIERMGRDCHPKQYIRELTQNAIEAILRTPERSGDIFWDFERLEDGSRKLCIIDTGDGMSPETLVANINALCSSSSVQSMDGNYGVGAKIAAVTRNRAGVEYLSWRDGLGHSIVVWKDPDTNEYGLKQHHLSDDRHVHVLPLDDDEKPANIADHGTKVLLWGNDPKEDTWMPGRDLVLTYLNERYFRISEGIAIRVREYETAKNRPAIRRVTGMRDYLERNHETKGSLELRGATAHWWIKSEDEANYGGVLDTKGHVAALYHDELYEKTSGMASRQALQSFGVVFGTQRVVIYVEPSLPGLTTNTARTQLLVSPPGDDDSGEPLPWVEWQNEFREKMPKPIIDMMDSVSRETISKDQEKSIRERLKPLLQLFTPVKYRPAKSGDSKVDELSLAGGGAPQPSGGTKLGGASPGNPGGRSRGNYVRKLREDGVKALAVSPDSFPQVIWCDEVDVGEGRAAVYEPQRNIIKMNREFRIFSQMADMAMNEFELPPGARPVVTEIIHTWYAQSLTETVVGISAMSQNKHWTSDDLDRAWSPEALTASVMQVYHVLTQVKREVGSKFGGRKK